MEFKKCARCGCFFASDDNTCCKCQKDDHADISKLKMYLDENIPHPITVEELSLHTGVTTENLTRYMLAEEFTPFIQNFNVDVFHIDLN